VLYKTLHAKIILLIG